MKNDCKQPHANPIKATVDSTQNHTGSVAIGPSDLAQIASVIHNRQLATPLLLLLAGHRPLTFAAGQFLLTLAPMCALLGWEKANEWADFLSAPNANQHLLAALNSQTIDPNATPIGTGQK